MCTIRLSQIVAVILAAGQERRDTESEPGHSHRMKTWKILRDCRGRGVYWATTGVAHLRNLNLAS